MNSNKYGFWIIQDKGDKLQLPINPSEFQVGNKAKNTTVDIDGLGSITLMGDPNLITIAFKSELPANYYLGCAYKDIPEPLELAKRIDSMKLSGPVNLVITGIGLSLKTTITDFSYTEKGGDVGTLYYSLSFEEYRSAKTSKVKVINGKVIFDDEVPRGDTRVKNKTHTVIAGESLYSIAKKELNDGSRWKEIFKLNANIVANAAIIRIGQVLKLPN